MLRMIDTEIKNARVFNDVKLSLANQGIVAVKGKNGVGKSTLFNLIESSFFGAMPNGDKKNDLVIGKGNSSISISCEKNGKAYAITQKRVSGRWKYTILEDDKDVTPHAQKDQLDKISNILDLSQREFQGSVHLTQGGAHLLIKGKPKERKDYIADFYNMDKRFDEVQGYAKKEREDISKKIESLNSLSHTREVLQQDFETLSLMDEVKLKADLDKAQQARDSFRVEVEKAKKAVEKATKYEELIPVVESMPEAEKEKAKAEDRIAELKAIISQADLVKDFNDKANKNNKELDLNKAEIEKLKDSIPADWSNLGYEYLVDFNNKLSFKKGNTDVVKPLVNELNSLPEVEEVDVTPFEKDYETELKNYSSLESIRSQGIEVEKVKERLASIAVPSIDLNVNFQEKIEALNSEIFTLDNKKLNYSKIKPSIDELNSLPEVEEVDLSKTEEDLRNIKTQISFLQSKMESVKNGKCHVCGAEHDSDNLKSDEDLLAQYKKSEKDFQDYITQTRDSNKIALRRSQLFSVVQGCEEFTAEDESRLNALMTEVSEIKSKVQEIEGAKKLMQERELLESQIKGKNGWSGEDEHNMEDLKADLNQLRLKIEDFKSGNKVAQRRKVILAQIKGKELLSDTEIQQYEALQKILPLMKRLGDLERLIEGKTYEDLKSSIDVKAFKEEEDSLRAFILEANKVINAKNSLPEKPEQKLDELNSLQKDLIERLAKVDEIFIKINQDLAVVEQNNSRYAKLKKQLDEMDEKLNELPELTREQYFWKTMEDAYGPKGLRLNHLDKIMNMVMQRLPIYTNYLFEESINFYHKCEAGQIEIFAERTRNNGEKYSYDISSMSFGETKKLSIAFMLALSDSVPKRKRCNILILDEVDSPLDKDSKYMFVNELLPTLSKDYESIFVISHSTESAQANVFDKVWLVERLPDQTSQITVK